MQPDELTHYLERLLGRPVALDQPLKLTSAQGARLAGWLGERAVPLKELRAILSAPFLPAVFLKESDPLPPPRSVQAPASGAAPREASGASPALRIGIDIQRIDELIDADLPDLKASAELTAIFTLREISYAQSRSEPAATLAGLFAAKEALRKSDASLMERALPELEVLPDEEGRPRFGGHTLSISHSGGFAIAVAASAAPAPAPAGVREPVQPVTFPDAPPPAAPRGLSGRAKAAFAAMGIVIVILLLNAIGVIHLVAR